MPNSCYKFFGWMPTVPRNVVHTVNVVGAGFLLVCGLADAANTVMSDAEKNEIRERLGPYFDTCLRIATEFAFCTVAAAVKNKYGENYGLAPGQESYDCTKDTAPAAGFRKYNFPDALQETCMRTMLPHEEVTFETVRTHP